MTITKAFELTWRAVWIAPAALLFMCCLCIGMGPRKANLAMKVMTDALNNASRKST